MLVRIVFGGFGSWSGARSSDEIVTFLGGTRYCRCSRVMGRGLEIRVLDDANRDTRSLIRPGDESSEGSAQLIRRLGLLRESAPGSTHCDEEVLMGRRSSWVGCGWVFWSGWGG
jgi:hypothetical protein